MWPYSFIMPMAGGFLAGVGFLVEIVERIEYDSYQDREHWYYIIVVVAFKVESLNENMCQNDGELDHLYGGDGLFDWCQFRHNPIT